MGPNFKGLMPREGDVIITGRSYEERATTKEHFEMLGLPTDWKVYFAPWPIVYKTRSRSGMHKAMMLLQLIADGNKIDIHFEDDPIQAAVIRKLVPEVTVVMITHKLTEK